MAMAFPRTVRAVVLLSVALSLAGTARAADYLRIATYNIENYLDAPAGTRPSKSAEARAKVRECLRALQAGVVALQEVGGSNSLAELRASLKSEGLDYPFWEMITGHDTNIHVAVLSQVPMTARRPHTNDSFLLYGRRFHVNRGFAEMDIQVNPNFSFTLITAHLKSRLPSAEADEAELREQEALLLREKIDHDFKEHPGLNLVVLGDFNDTKDSLAIRSLMGRGRTALIDTRPAERNGDESLKIKESRYAPRTVNWTYFYGKADTYSRIDYILISQAMASRWVPEETWALNMPNWGVASDHRPIVAGFRMEETK